MTLFHLLSDLHLEHRPHLDISFRADVDVVLLAGDIASGHAALPWIDRRRSAALNPRVLYISGNHEPYGFEQASIEKGFRDEAWSYGVEFAQRRAIDIKGVRVLSCTLWTDYTVQWRKREKEMPSVMARQAMLAQAAYEGLNDFRWIKAGGRFLRPHDVLAWHAQDLAWLTAELQRAKDDGVPVVVMTHHAPVRDSISPFYDGDPLTGAFANDLQDLIETYQPKVWVHGHVHNQVELQVAGCWILANPAGYSKEENPHFNPNYAFSVDHQGFVSFLD